jgi:tetratricopeptide (TPR) repeat protein
MQRGDLAGALDACIELCRQAPGDGRAWYQRGTANGMLGNLHEAVDCFARAVSLQPGIPGLHASHGGALLALGRDEEAVAELERAVAQDDADFRSFNNLGILYLKHGDRARAESCYRRATALCPEFTDAACNLASLLKDDDRTREAIMLCGDILASEPGHRQSFALLCNCLLDSRALDAALQTVNRTAPRIKKAGNFLYGIARKLHAQENFGDACKVLNAVIPLFPGQPRFGILLADCLGANRQTDEAARLLERLETDDLNTEQLTMVANTWLSLRRQDRAETCIRRAMEIEPDQTDAHINMARAMHARGDSDAAIVLLTQLLQRHPNNADILLEIGVINYQLGRNNQAIAAYREAIKAQPDNVQAYSDLGTVLQQCNRYNESMASYRQALALDPDYLPARCNVASLHRDQGDHAEAIALYDRILETTPDFERALSGKASCLERMGQTEEAFWIVAPIVESGHRYMHTLIVYALACPRGEEEQQAIRLLREALDNRVPYAHNRMEICFCLGKLLERSGAYDDAFCYYKAGNDLSTEEFNPDVFEQTIKSFIREFSAAHLQALPESSVTSGKPVFIVGMPRSGTSLTEQILSSHPDVHGAGELSLIRDVASNIMRATGSDKPYPFNLDSLSTDILDQLAAHYLRQTEAMANGEPHITDKMPSNFMFLGLIQMLFPNARVIHCNRDPVDTCLSCYCQNFTRGQDFSFQLKNIATYYNGYRELMAHWKSVLRIPVLDVVYEELVADPETRTREILAFLGLDWNPACLDFHKSERVVRTASYMQVRQPVYKTSAGKWRNYEKHLGELLDTLDYR